MKTQKNGRPAGIAIVVAGLAVALMPAVANAAADTGWIPNRVSFHGLVDGVMCDASGGARSLSAWEDSPSSGDIGLKIHYGTLLSSILWADQSVTWTAPYDISEFRVYH